MSDPVLLRMRAAGVPPYAFPSTLKEMGKNCPPLARLASAVKTKEFKKGVAGLVSYAFFGPRRVLTAATMAKELVLVGEQVRCTSALALAAEYRKQDWLPYAPEFTGYLVIPDFAAGVKFQPSRDLQEVIDFLLAHIGAGGGLVLGVCEDEQQISTMPEEFALALQVFECISTN